MMIFTNDGGLAWTPATKISELGEKTSIEDFQNWCASSFQDSYPVVFETGREALRAVGQLLFSRGLTIVSVPPFTSQCVVQSFAAAGLVTKTELDPELALDFIYHQYGHFFEQASSALVEDSVDSIFTLGRSPFRTDSEFAIWSFRKSFGTQLGGLVWCRDLNSARTIASESKVSLEKINALERCLGYIKRSWSTLYGANEKRVVRILQMFERAENQSFHDRYVEMMREGILPSAIEIDDDLVPMISSTFNSNVQILTRHSVNSPGDRQTKTLFFPIWQI